MGTFTRQYKAVKDNGRTVSGDTTMGQGTQNDNFLLKSADLVGTNIVVGSKQYAQAKQKRFPKKARVTGVVSYAMALSLNKAADAQVRRRKKKRNHTKELKQHQQR